MLSLLSLSPSSYCSDSEMINAALERAQSGDTVTIPPTNPRTGACVYMIDAPLLLPSDVTVLLDNCHLKLTPDAECNIFRNKSLYTEGYQTLAGEQRNIRIIGRGYALLDGEGHNDIFEWSQERDGRPSVYVNNLILLHNVDGFEISGIHLREQRWWAINLLFCSNGRVSDVTIRTDSRFSNQDGINLRVGCHHVVLERISGNSGDDFIALSAIGLCTRYLVEGKATDIAHVEVRDIVASSMHESIVALRANDGHQVHHIDISNVYESNQGNENILPYTTLLLGQAAFYAVEPGKHGCMHHISVRNVRTLSGGAAITLGNTLVDSEICGVRASGCLHALTTKNFDHLGPTRLVKRGQSDDPNFPQEGISMERVLIKDVWADLPAGYAAIDLSEMREDDFITDCFVEGIHSENGPVLLCREGIRPTERKAGNE